MNMRFDKFRPLLAATIENDEQLASLRYPLIGSPKVDGIRVLIHPELGPVTRSLKPVRNNYIRNTLLSPEYYGLDGEIVVGPITAPDVFQRTSSGVMSGDGTPQFRYWVFDHFLPPTDQYQFRHRRVMKWIDHDIIELLPAVQIQSMSDVLNLERAYIESGFEGIMLRAYEAPYKFNRSTLREQTLLKLKRFQDAEATVCGFLPLEHNQNAQTRDNLGLAQRSDHKNGKVVADTLGCLLVRHDQFGEFSIGSGFSADQRQEIWQHQPFYQGKTVTFKYQTTGIKEKPRFPIFLRFRSPE